MGKYLITGVAGFIGSHMANALVNLGEEVIGIDDLNPYYSPEIKLRNISNLMTKSNFEWVKADIQDYIKPHKLSDIDYILHFAAQAGVKSSFGSNFSDYCERNILATQHLLEAAKHASKLKNIIYASSSSVYGDTNHDKLSESTSLNPVSPYGVTKKSTEDLCRIYQKSFGIPITILRFFSVYGPRQRPDMAFHIFFRKIIEKKPITVTGDGTQSRDFTNIEDIVYANLLCLNNPKAIGHTFNIASDNSISINQILSYIKGMTDSNFTIKYKNNIIGEMHHTSASITHAKNTLGYQPKVSIENGLESQWKWYLKCRENLKRDQSFPILFQQPHTISASHFQDRNL